MPDYVPLTDIIFEGNLDFSEEVIKPIRESIEQQGLHHPLLVVEYPSVPITYLRAYGTTDVPLTNYKLIAGRKRLLALKQLGIKEAPVKIYPSGLTDNQLFEISLHENLKRWNLPWYEQVEIEAKLHSLKLEMNGGARKWGGSKDRGKAPWTQADTARELGIAVGALAEDMQLARAVAVNPSLKNVKDKTTALKLIRVQAKRQEAEAFALISPEIEMNQVLLGDSLEILKQFPRETFDVCLTDPPWSSYKEESLTAVQIDLLPIFAEIYRVMKGDSFLYVIISSVDFLHYSQELPKLGFKCQEYPLIWHKTRTITHGRRNWEYARDYEPIMLAVKGSPVLTSVTEISSILEHENLHYTKMIHPNEKPLSLLVDILRNCSYEGNCILDPFAGSGVTLEAAKKMNRHWIGIEKEKKFYDQIVRRIA